MVERMTEQELVEWKLHTSFIPDAKARAIATIDSLREELDAVNAKLGMAVSASGVPAVADVEDIVNAYHRAVGILIDPDTAEAHRALREREWDRLASKLRVKMDEVESYGDELDRRHIERVIDKNPFRDEVCTCDDGVVCPSAKRAVAGIEARAGLDDVKTFSPLPDTPEMRAVVGAAAKHIRKMVEGNRPGESDEEWAVRMGKELTEAGEQEYGPDYPSNKALRISQAEFRADPVGAVRKAFECGSVVIEQPDGVPPIRLATQTEDLSGSAEIKTLNIGMFEGPGWDAIKKTTAERAEKAKKDE